MVVSRPIADIHESLAVFVDDIDETAAAAVLALLALGAIVCAPCIAHRQPTLPHARSGFEGGAHPCFSRLFVVIDAALFAALK
jgi:hypothetical protein